ncbi:hypothetical protein ABK040_015627 [Willaertia magna]
MSEENKSNLQSNTTTNNASSSSEKKPFSHPQPSLQALYSAGRGGLARGGGYRGRGGRGNYRGRGSYNNNNRDRGIHKPSHHHKEGKRSMNNKEDEITKEENKDNNNKQQIKETNATINESDNSEEEDDNSMQDIMEDDEDNNNEEDNSGEEEEDENNDLNEENVPEYIKYLRDYKKNYKNPIFSMLYKKPLETPEDIQKYREERKRNYPTKDNIIKKEIELAERRKKGEIIMGASDKIKSLMNLMGIEKRKNEEENNEEDIKNNKTFIYNLLNNEMEKDKIILLQCFRHIIYNNFYCNKDELTDEVKNKLLKLQELTSSEMKKVEELRRKKLNLPFDLTNLTTTTNNQMVSSSTNNINNVSSSDNPTTTTIESNQKEEKTIIKE